MNDSLCRQGIPVVGGSQFEAPPYIHWYLYETSLSLFLRAVAKTQFVAESIWI